MNKVTKHRKEPEPLRKDIPFKINNADKTYQIPMCGFLGEFIFESKGKLTEPNEFARLLELSKHRGYDSSKIESGDNY